jgi:Flp pilus assembly protein TadG
MAAVGGGGWSDRVRGERGQALVLTVLPLVSLLGAAALALDVGSWFRQKRQDQIVVDAAALAGAQALPDDPSKAITLALDYASKNGVTLPAGHVSISSGVMANDTISVAYNAPAPTFFAHVFGLNSVNVGADAAARSDVPGAARWVAPIVVPTTNPQLQCNPPPCSGTTQINLLDLHHPGNGNAAGSFALLDLIQNDTGNVGAGTLAGWMANGDSNAMPLGTYDAAPSTNFNSSGFQAALQARVGSEVLFPVYQPPIQNGGSNAAFNIVGWVGFHMDSESANGNSGTLVGHFTRYIAQGLQAQTFPGNDFGVRVIQLIK